jgi:hypothetical protein
MDLHGRHGDVHDRERPRGRSYPLITLTVNVPANAPPFLTNTVTVSGGNEASNVIGNNVATDPVTILQHTTTTVSGGHPGLRRQRHAPGDGRSPGRQRVGAVLRQWLRCRHRDV